MLLSIHQIEDLLPFTLQVNSVRLLNVALLSSLSGVAFWMAVANLFFYSSGLMTMQLYLGLAIFSLYVVFDTQVLIARAEAGDKDYLSDSLNLYIDLIALFVRVRTFIFYARF